MSVKVKAVIAGTGGQAQVVWAAWKASPDSRVEIIGFLEAPDVNAPDVLMDLPVYRHNREGLHDIKQRGCTAFYFGLDMGQASARRWRTFNTLCSENLEPLTLVHPAAMVSPLASVGAGSYVGTLAVIQPFARVGAAGIINTGALIEHHARIEHNVHVGPRTVLCGQVSVGAHALVGAGSVVLQGLAVGTESTVGAGSVVLENVPDYASATGNPAQIIRSEKMLSA